MRNAAVLGALALVLAAASGCGEDDRLTSYGLPKESTEAPTPSATRPAPAPTEISVGRPFQMAAADGADVGTVTVAGLEWDPQCADPQAVEPRGRYLAVEMDAQIGSYAGPAFGPEWFEEVRADGYTVDAAPSSQACIAGRPGFRRFAPGSRYRGWVLLDVQGPDSELVLSDPAGDVPAPAYRLPLPDS